MNRVILIGRLVKEPQIKTSSKGLKIANYTIAVERPKTANGERQSDFINCVAFGKNADFAEKYLPKGIKIAIQGSWQTGSYTNSQGEKVYTNTCLVELHEFVEKKSAQPVAPQVNIDDLPTTLDNSTNDFMEVPDLSDMASEFPFE